MSRIPVLLLVCTVLAGCYDEGWPAIHGDARNSDTAVEIILAPEEDPLTDQRIEDATIGIDMSPTLLGKYYVEITNLPTVLNSFNVRATTDAQRAYEDQRFPHMILFIFDDDVKEGQKGLRRAVHYKFPEKFVRTGEIELSQEPVIAEFKLIPLPSAEGE